jgi:serine/threonine protein phosphatase 1
MPGFFSKLFGGGSDGPAPPPLPRLATDQWPSVVYAIGDVHGCRDQLVDLQNRIVADAASIGGEKWIVMLGDYIDRGPDPAGVLDILIAPPPTGFRRICLAGNHEIMMLDFLAGRDPDANWLRWGGLETLASYGLGGVLADDAPTPAMRKALSSHVPQEHLMFLNGLSACLSLPGVTFVHAGIRPGVAMELQGVDDLLWIREPFLSDPGIAGHFVVHGHTPGPEPVVTAGRIGVDTGAYDGGPLTALRLQPAAQPVFLASPPG